MSNRQTITVQTRSHYNGHLGVPSYEVRRCRLMQTDLRVELVNKLGQTQIAIHVPHEDLDSGERTGIIKKLHWGSEYEIINFPYNKYAAEKVAQ